MLRFFISFCILSLCQLGCQCNDSKGYSKPAHGIQKSSGKILFTLPPYFLGSHYPQLAILASGLSAKGHQIHLLGNALVKEYQDFAVFNASRASWYELSDAEEFAGEVQSVLSGSTKGGFGPAGFNSFVELTKLMSKECRQLFSNSKLLKLLQSESYDLLVTDLVFPCDALVARFLNIPFVGVTTSREYPYLRTGNFGFPSELSYVPEVLTGVALTDKMTFVERVVNVLLRFLTRYVFPYILLADFKEIQKEHHIDEDTDLLSVIGKASLWISYSDLSLDFPQPTMPNYVRSGGMALKDALPLEKQLEEFVQGSGDYGVIIFTLGSMIGSLPDDQTTEAVAKVFSRLPQRVIWRHTGGLPENLGNNTMIMKWIKQNDLLGHPKARLFIGHGGLNGAYEALYHAVPMILIPQVAPDQWDTAARVESKGMGLHLDSNTITEETFYDAVTTVLNDPRYQERVSHYSAIIRDLQPAKDRVVFWIEHVLKFGDEHLRAHVFELNLIQYYLIDVAAFFMLMAATIALVLRFAFRFICRCCRNNKKKIA